ncbi:hypothetical protein [Asticcacaulis taihuensis]|uniref:hypothetical protein n=1 Tax=Asticcacaulis taihuensis TaxID=260084 RepID=UPI0026EADFB5|nr:hypothetical protein [Asticcacaulis taihuensis]
MAKATERLVRQRPIRRVVGGGYSQHDHQWLVDVCSRHLTIAEFGRLQKRGRFFKDYPALLNAAVAYFGHTRLGWAYIAVEKPLNMQRNYMARLCRKIEDLRRDGDVFERIDKWIEVYSGGLL